MKTYEILEDGVCFATIEAEDAEAALGKAEAEYPRSSSDYNGYVGPVEWAAFEPGAEAAASIKAVTIEPSAACRRAAAAAISKSIRENRVVRIYYHAFSGPELAAICEDLAIECEDHVRNGSEEQFWGEDDTGEWRVHVEVV